MGLWIGNNKDGERCLIRDETGMCKRAWSKRELLAIMSAGQIETDYSLIEEWYPQEPVDGYGPHHERLYMEKDMGQVRASSSRM